MPRCASWLTTPLQIPVVPAGLPVAVAFTGDAKTSMPANTPGRTIVDATRRAVKIEVAADASNVTPGFGGCAECSPACSHVAAATTCPIWLRRRGAR